MPSHQLELALWLEADRMGTLLDALSQENLDNQREVVKNEKRWSYDNRPYGDWNERLNELLFPPEHPYHHTTIGSMEDLDAASLDDVKAFFRTHYAPNNAVLSLVGDVDPAEARALGRPLLRQHPGQPGHPAARRPEPPADARRGAPDDGRGGRARCRGSTSAFRAPVYGDHRLDALEVASQILAGGKGSRLHRRLVREDRIAQDVILFTLGFTGGASVTAGWATARPGIPIEKVEAALLEELERLGTELVTDDEMVRARALVETDELGALQRVEERADRLSMYATLFDDPGLDQHDARALPGGDPGGDPRRRRGRVPARQPRGRDLPAGAPARTSRPRTIPRPRRPPTTRRSPRDRHRRRRAADPRPSPAVRLPGVRARPPAERADRHHRAAARPSARVGDARAAQWRGRRAGRCRGSTVLAARALPEGTENYDAIALVEASSAWARRCTRRRAGIRCPPASRSPASASKRRWSCWPRWSAGRRSRTPKSTACATSG